MNVAQYLVKRLRSVGIEHVFGVPGDFNLPLTKLICETNDLKWIGTCGELGAAYAADGYARIKGAGALITTYVFTLTMNKIAKVGRQQRLFFLPFGHVAAVCRFFLD